MTLFRKHSSEHGVTTQLCAQSLHRDRGSSQSAATPSLTWPINGLSMRGLLGYDYETAAEVIRVPVGTIRSRLARAREAMSVLLAESARVDETGTN